MLSLSDVSHDTRTVLDDEREGVRAPWTLVEEDLDEPGDEELLTRCEVCGGELPATRTYRTVHDECFDAVVWSDADARR